MTTRVVDSRTADRGIRRRRECQECGERFTTYEQYQQTVVMIVKKDGRREEFQREKLLYGLRVATRKRPLPANAVEAIVDDIERRLMASGRPEVPSRVLGEMVITQLKMLDPIAYIRFASVYHQFVSLEEMLEELNRIARSPLGIAPEQAKLFEDELDALVRGVARAAGRQVAETTTSAPAKVTPLNGRVLVVDDNSVNRKILARQLELAGASTDVAASGEEALELWRKGGYDLVHVFTYSFAFGAPLLQAMRHTPYLFHVIVDEPGWQPGWNRWLYGQLLSRAARPPMSRLPARVSISRNTRRSWRTSSGSTTVEKARSAARARAAPPPGTKPSARAARVRRSAEVKTSRVAGVRFALLMPSILPRSRPCG